MYGNGFNNQSSQIYEGQRNRLLTEESHLEKQKKLEEEKQNLTFWQKVKRFFSTKHTF